MKPLYSTDKTQPIAQSKTKHQTPAPGKGPLKMRLETKGRGGKEVTVLFNLPFSSEEAKNLLSTLQTLLGTGGTFKEGQLEFRGDQRNKIEDYCGRSNIKIVRAGG